MTGYIRGDLFRNKKSGLIRRFPSAYPHADIIFLDRPGLDDCVAYFTYLELDRDWILYELAFQD